MSGRVSKDAMAAQKEYLDELFATLDPNNPSSCIISQQETSISNGGKGQIFSEMSENLESSENPIPNSFMKAQVPYIQKDQIESDEHEKNNEDSDNSSSSSELEKNENCASKIMSRSFDDMEVCNDAHDCHKNQDNLGENKLKEVESIEEMLKRAKQFVETKILDESTVENGVQNDKILQFNTGKYLPCSKPRFANRVKQVNDEKYSIKSSSHTDTSVDNMMEHTSSSISCNENGTHGIDDHYLVTSKLKEIKYDFKSPKLLHDLSSSIQKDNFTKGVFW